MPTNRRHSFNICCQKWQIIAAVVLVLLLCVVVLLQRQDDVPVLLKMDSSTETTSRLPLLHKTISALERALDHLFSIGEGTNLDTVFTVRIVEAQLRALHHNIIVPYEAGGKNDTLMALIEQINRIQDKAEEFFQRFKKIVNRNQPQYYKSMSFFLTAGTWDLWYPQRNINRNLMPTYGFEKTVNESLRGDRTDECMKDPFIRQCKFTKTCWDRMTNLFRSGFSLTHEALFLMNAFALGCRNEVEMSAHKWMNMSSDEILEREMAAVLHEGELISNQSFPLYLRDLFMEQVGFGGILGYRDFFRDDWLEQILSWQEEKGCFSLDYNATLAMLAKDFPNHPSVSHPNGLHSLVPLDRKSRIYYPAAPTHQIQKRNEVLLADGCWAHLTGVGVMALGQGIRYLLESTLAN